MFQEEQEILLLRSRETENIKKNTVGFHIVSLIQIERDSVVFLPFLLFFSRQTFLVFYKVLMAELEKAARKIPACKISDNSEVRCRTLQCVLLHTELLAPC